VTTHVVGGAHDRAWLPPATSRLSRPS